MIILEKDLILMFMKLSNKIKSIFHEYKLEIIVFAIFVLMRVPSLGQDMFNTDVWKWKARSYDFASGVFNLDFEKTIQKYHPGVTLMWISTFAIKFYNFYHKIILGTPALDNNIDNVFQLHFLQKLFIVLVLGFVMSTIFYVLRKLFRIKYATLSIFLLSFEPFYLALTRVMHLEGLMSTFMIASFVWFFYYLKNKNKKYMVISSLFTSLAILTKTSSVFMLLFIGLIYFIEIIDSKLTLKKKIIQFIKIYFSYLLFVILFFISIWPAMWTNAVKVMQTLYSGIYSIGLEGDHLQIFLGKIVEDPGMIFYPTVIFARSSLYIIFGFAGYLFIRHQIKDKEKNKFILYLLIFTFFYLLELTLSSKKLDRYAIPAILSLSLITSFFFEYLINHLIKIRFIKKYFFIIFIIPAFYYYFYLYPNYFSYYSPLVGGLRLGIFIIEPKWMIGQKEVVNFFNNLDDAKRYEKFLPDESLDSLLYKSVIDKKLTIGFPEKYYTQIWPFITKMGGRATITDLTPQAIKTKYFVYPVYDDNSSEENRFKLESMGSIWLHNVKIYNVYKKVN